MRQALGVLAGLSSAQWGLFTSSQAACRGVSRLDLSRLAESGLLERVVHGVYRDAGAAGDEFEGLRSAWLAIVPKVDASARLQALAGDAVVSRASAAWLHGIGDLRADRYEFTSSVRRQTQREGVRISTYPVATGDVTIRHGLPATTVERTIADLVADRIDLSLVAKALGDAMRNGSVDLASLAHRLAPLAARNGCRAGDGQALLDRLLRLAGLDAQAMAKRFAGIESLARPIAVHYFQDLADQARRAQELVATMQIDIPDVTQFAAQADAIAKALRPQVDSLRALQEQHQGIAEDWQKVVERLAPNLEAFATASRYASAVGIESRREALTGKAAP